jgi:Spy/CpxP family protein refolding chaperone
MRYLLILILTTLFFLPTSGQTSADAQQRIQEEKVAFFNEQLDLTKAEAQKFWPVYNDYQNRKNRISNEKRTLMRYYVQNEKHMSKAEITETLNKYIAFEKHETELLAIYNEKFREILPDEKVLKIYAAEVQFKDYLLKKLRTD